MHVTDVPAAQGLWIMCPPILEEATHCRLDYRGIARQIAARGYSVAEFDYAGTGDSTGSHLDASLAKRRSDIEDVRSACKDCSGSHNTILFGIRTGANLCLDLVIEDRSLRGIGWFPIANGNEFCENLLNFNLSAQYAAYASVKVPKRELLEELQRGGSLNVLGHEVSGPLFEDLGSIDLSGIPAIDGDRFLFVMAASKEAETLSPLLSERGCSTRVVTVRPFWQSPRFLDPEHRDLVDFSVDFLQHAYA